MALKSRTPLNVSALRRDFSTLPQIAKIKADANLDMVKTIKSGIEKRKLDIEKKERAALNEKLLDDLIKSDTKNRLFPVGAEAKKYVKYFTTEQLLGYRQKIDALNREEQKTQLALQADVFALNQLMGDKKFTSEQLKEIKASLESNPGAVYGAFIKRLEQAPKTEPRPSASIEEFRFYQQEGGELPYEEFLKLKKSGTTVNVGGEKFGTVPPGYQLIKNTDGSFTMEVIPGSPQEREMKEAAEAEKKKGAFEEASAKQKAIIVLDDIKRAIKIVDDPDSFATGFGGQIFQNIGGTAANNLQSLLTTVGANISFDQLQQMREASPTGGALGPVSDFENRQLQAVLGDLDISQTKEQLRKNLTRLEYRYDVAVNGKAAADARLKKAGITNPGFSEITLDLSTESDRNLIKSFPPGALIRDTSTGKLFKIPE